MLLILIDQLMSPSWNYLWHQIYLDCTVQYRDTNIRQYTSSTHQQHSSAGSWYCEYDSVRASTVVSSFNAFWMWQGNTYFLFISICSGSRRPEPWTENCGNTSDLTAPGHQRSCGQTHYTQLAFISSPICTLWTWCAAWTRWKQGGRMELGGKQ